MINNNLFYFPREMKLLFFFFENLLSSLDNGTLINTFTQRRSTIDNIEVARRAKFSSKNFLAKLRTRNETPSFEDIESFDINHNKEETMRYYVILLFNGTASPVNRIKIKQGKWKIEL